jgi:hypothetical protein
MDVANPRRVQLETIARDLRDLTVLIFNPRIKRASATLIEAVLDSGPVCCEASTQGLLSGRHGA